MNPSDDLIICRCENVCLGKIRQCLQSSAAASVNEVKKLTRTGMGVCQGRTCARTLELVLAQEAGIPLGTEPYHARPPVRPVALDGLAEGAEEFSEPAGPVSVVMLRKPERNTGCDQPHARPNGESE